MWDQLPLDLLSHIFSFLPPDSLPCCMSTCRYWHRATSLAGTTPARHAPWLLAVPARTQCRSCFTYSPSGNRWYSLPLRFLPSPIRLIAPVTGLLLCKLATSPALCLLLCNPFTRQFKFLPQLNHSRTNPAVGVLIDDDSQSFRVLVAGGASGASYEQNVEVYDSKAGEWSNRGSIPLEFAVRLTVWTPNESVYGDDGVMYWMTSARAYSMVGFDVQRGSWREVKVPLADQLEWAAIVKRSNGRVGLVGGSEQINGEEVHIWELGEGDEWVLVGLAPLKLEGSCIKKCVGGGEYVYLLKDLGSKVLVGTATEWFWIEGCCYSVPKTPVKGVLIHPSLSPFPLLS